ncbi:unnamed protein product [marine sediment metagenome]|uniref:Uncharacterized protein n=1 Tax=marine sediment metagenome TaxID=412755 RepID=X1UMX3_9ZZZZ
MGNFLIYELRHDKGYVLFDVKDIRSFSHGGDNGETLVIFSKEMPGGDIAVHNKPPLSADTWDECLTLWKNLLTEEPKRWVKPNGT